MLNGVKKIFDYAMTEGERKGFKKGSMYTLGTCGIIYVATKVAPLLKQRITKRKEHAAEGEKILSELKAELQEPVDCETEDVE